MWTDHDHRQYAEDGHDHDLNYAEKYHRHYDDEHTVEQLRDELRSYIDGLREDLSCLYERVYKLEKDTDDE